MEMAYYIEINMNTLYYGDNLEIMREYILNNPMELSIVEGK